MTRLQAHMISSTGVAIAGVTTNSGKKGFGGGHGRAGGGGNRQRNNDLFISVGLSVAVTSSVPVADATQVPIH